MVPSCFYLHVAMLSLLGLLCLFADTLSVTILILECITMLLLGLFAMLCIILSTSSVFIWLFLLIVFGTIDFILLTALILFLDKFTKIK